MSLLKKKQATVGSFDQEVVIRCMMLYLCLEACGVRKVKAMRKRARR